MKKKTMVHYVNHNIQKTMRSINELVLLIVAFTICSCAKDNAENTILPLNETVKESNIGFRSDVSPESDNFEVTKEMALLYANSLKNKAIFATIDTYYYEGVPCLYIINYEQGWMVIPTDSRVQTVLGESDVDHLYTDELDNDGVRAWLEVSAEYVFKVKTAQLIEYDERNLQLWEQIRKCGPDENLIGFYKPTNADWVRFTSVNTNIDTLSNQPHLLQTKWGQGAPWNCSLPIDPIIDSISNQQIKFKTGCVPTAVSQVLYYFHNETGYPNDFYYYLQGYVSQHLYSSSGTDYYEIGINRSPSTPVANSIRWDYMPLTANDNGNFTYVSDLMMEIGYRMNANYSVASTGAVMVSYTHVAPCGISANSYYYSYDTVRNNIINRKPVLVSAFTNYNAGHSWVIDGCVDITTTTTTTSTYYRYQEGEMYDPGAVFLTDEEVLAEYPNAYDGMVVVTNAVVENKYLLMNFGFNGSYDDGHYGILPSGNDWRGYTNTICTIYNIVTGQLN